MKITLEFLNKIYACPEDITFVKENKLIGLEVVDFIEKLIELDKLQLASWLTARALSKVDRVRYAVFAAEQVLHIFEEKYLGDDRPRKAIEAARFYINNPSVTASRAVAAAARDAYDAYAYAAASVAYAPSRVAAAAHAAYDAAHVADAAHAAYDAYATYDVADDKMFKKIIKNGIKLLKEV